MKAEDLIARFEGCHRWKGEWIYPYLDPIGIPTQAYGRVVPSMAVPPIDGPTARNWLEEDAEEARRAALRLSPILADHPDKLAAVTSWIYNLGVGRYQGSTMRRRINEGDWEGAAAECRKWVMAGGRKLNGLVIRREAEASLIGGAS